MECLQCPKCYAYAYDTLVQTDEFSERVVNLDRITAAAHKLTPNFMRASLDKSETKHLWIMCIEVGAMFRSREGVRNSMTILHIWLHDRIQALGNLLHFHFLHTGGFVPQEQEPVAGPLPAPPLRIRIPVQRS